MRKISRYDLIDGSILAVSLASFQFLLIPTLTKINIALGMAVLTVGGMLLFVCLITMVDSKAWLKPIENMKRQPL